MWKTMHAYFDTLEDRVRFRLSRYPVAYALVGAIGIVLVWKGVWETAASFQILDGFMSFFVGSGILLMSGLLVSFFIGDNILISGYKKEKKLIEKAESEVRSEKEVLDDVVRRLERIEHILLTGETSAEKSIE